VKRSPLSLLVAAAFSFACCAPIAACEQQSADCSELGVNSSDAPTSTNAQSANIVVLIDLPNNNQNTIEKVVNQVYNTIERELDGITEFSLTAGVYTGQSNNVTTVTCMDGTARSFTYVEGENNETRQKRERKEYFNSTKKQLENALATSTHNKSTSGDFRSLLSWSKDKITQSNTGNKKVVLWSNFLSNGTDCLNIESPSSGSSALADEIAQRCQDADLLPTLGDTDVQVLGSGYGTDTSLASFSSQLATAFCKRISTNCRVSQGK
jgi:lipoprotein